MTSVVAPATQPESEPPRLAQIIGRIAGILASENFPTGDRAALKRMAPNAEPPLAFYRFAFRHLPENWERQRHAWQTLIAGIALMCLRSRQSPHDSHRPLGQALAEQKYSEARLERLLAAEEEVLHTLLLRAVRFLAAKGERVDWTDFTRLALITTDTEKREKIRREIAGDYYRNLNKEKD